MAQEERMEVEHCSCTAASATGGGGATLRRSNSAPLISHLSETASVFQPSSLRCRRSSASVNLGCPSSSFPLASCRTFSSRVDQIRQEETMDVMNRETAHERGIHTAMQMSCSWEDSFTLQYFSSSQPILIPKGGVTPNSSPSPTRRFGRRSVSPSVALRPSALGPLKRKGDMEVDSPPKKLFVSGIPNLPDPEIQPRPPSHRMDSVSGSPPQTVPPSASSPPSTERGFPCLAPPGL